MSPESGVEGSGESQKNKMKDKKIGLLTPRANQYVFKLSRLVGAICLRAAWTGLGVLATWCALVGYGVGPGNATGARFELKRKDGPAQLPRPNPPVPVGRVGEVGSSGKSVGVERLFARLATARNPFQKVLALAGWADSASEDDLIAALAALPSCELDQSYRDEVVALMIASLASSDAEVAVAVAYDMVKAQETNGYSIELAYLEWVDANPVAAMGDAIAQLPTVSVDGRSILFKMLNQIGETDSDLADGIATDMARSADARTAETGSGFLSERLWEVWNDRANTQEAWDWINAQNPPAETRDVVRTQMLRIAVATEHYDAAGELLPLCANVEDEQLRRVTIQGLAEKYPQQVQSLIGQMKDPAQRREEIGLMIAAQSVGNREASVNWLLAQPASALRDADLAVAATMLEQENMILSLKTVEGMRDTQEKTAALHRIGFYWLTHDSEVARQVVPREIVERYDHLVEVYASGDFNVIPGLIVSFSFPSNKSSK
jgi:hypothetical protein